VEKAVDGVLVELQNAIFKESCDGGQVHSLSKSKKSQENTPLGGESPIGLSVAPNWSF